MLSASPASVSEIILRSVPFCSIDDLALLSVRLITAPESVLVNVAQVFPVPVLTFKDDVKLGDILDPAIAALAFIFAFVIVPSGILESATELLASFTSVIAASAILAVVTEVAFIEEATIALSAIFAVVTASSAILAVVTASSAILTVVTDEFCSTAVLTVLLLGVPMLTVLPTTTAK